MIQFVGITRQDRHRATELVRDALLSANAWIVDHQQFSNAALCIRFEADSADLPRVVDALAATGLDFAHTGSPSQRPQLQGTVQLTFVHNEPDLRVPGPLG